MAICSSCGDETGPWECEICKVEICVNCPDCHNELIHNVIKNQNIHIIGSSPSMLNSIDDDPDAFKPSWKSE